MFTVGSTYGQVELLQHVPHFGTLHYGATCAVDWLVRKAATVIHVVS